MLFVMGEGWPEMPLEVNVKRGMLRLWIVLSIAWAALAVPLTWKDLTQTRCERWEGSIRTSTRRPWECDPVVRQVQPSAAPGTAVAEVVQQEFLITSSTGWQSVFRAPEGAKQQEIHRAAREHFGPSVITNQELSTIIPVIYRYPPYWPSISFALIFIIAPPAVVFFVGMAVFWISAGFRAKDQ